MCLRVKVLTKNVKNIIFFWEKEALGTQFKKTANQIFKFYVLVQNIE